MKKAIVTGATVSVREGPAEKYTELGTLECGDEIYVLDDALSRPYVRVVWRVGYAYGKGGAYIERLNDCSVANAIVKGTAIDVRKGRGQSYKLLGTYQPGQIITVLDDVVDGSYVRVLWQAGYAYCGCGAYIRFADEAGACDVNNAIVQGSSISVRKGPSLSYARLGMFKPGEQIRVLEPTLNKAYVRVVWKGGEGYAYSKYGAYIRFLSTPETPETPVETPEVIIKRILFVMALYVGNRCIFRLRKAMRSANRTRWRCARRQRRPRCSASVIRASSQQRRFPQRQQRSCMHGCRSRRI